MQCARVQFLHSCALHVLSLPPLCAPCHSTALHVPMLYEFVTRSGWEEAARLCRFVREQAMWGALCGMALQANHLDTTEIALAALGVVSSSLLPLLPLPALQCSCHLRLLRPH